ncbi:hypothetical protein HKCCSP123_04625 [Rhodobacterales bacterium HKCCSP123]|nr:hypothetical protein [Rhodobacterales bacterium HKCCSP123]
MSIRPALLTLALGIAAAAPIPAAAQSVGVLLDRCAGVAQDYFGAPRAQTNMRYNGARVDGTETVGGEIYLRGRAPYIACAFTRPGLRQTEFFVDGQDQSGFLRVSGGGGGGGGGGAGAGQTDTVRVQFPAGSSGTELSDNLAPGASRRYVLGAGDGQFLYVRVAPWNGSLEYQIFNPDNSFLLDLIPARQEYRGQLWQSGDHVVEVVNRSNATVSYNVIFGIR